MFDVSCRSSLLLAAKPMILPLQLRHDPAPRHAAEAWFLTGNDPARWLDELAHCGLAEVETRLFLISGQTIETGPAPSLSPPAEERDGERRRFTNHQPPITNRHPLVSGLLII